MAIGDALLDLPQIGPAAPAPVPPPMTPEEFALQLQGYRNAFTQMPTPTAGNEALLRMGLGLLQPIRPGDSPGGVFSRAGTEAQNYYTALRQQEQQNALQGMQLGQRERQLRGQEAQTAESVATSRQTRAVAEAQAPLILGQAQQAYRMARSNLELLAAEEAAGNRSPEFLQRKAVAEVAVREALADLYRKHSELYRKTAEAAPSKGGKQTLATKTVENPDGTTSQVSTIVVNGVPVHHILTLPKFNDIKAATDFATKEVNKETPSAWNPFAGKAPYQGTAEEEVARRVKAYMTPQLLIVGPGGKQLSPQEFERLGEEQAKTVPGGPPKPSTAGATTPQGTLPGAKMPPAFPREGAQDRVGAAERSLGIIRTELRDAKQRKAPPEEIAALEREEQRAMETMKGGASGFAPKAPTAPARTTFVRDAQGNLVRQGAQPSMGAQPVAGPTPVTPMETKGVALDRARATLRNAQAAVMRYGVRAQRDDPAGYRAALADLARAQAEVGQAQQEYEAEVAPNMPFARPMLRKP